MLGCLLLVAMAGVAAVAASAAWGPVAGAGAALAAAFVTGVVQLVVQARTLERRSWGREQAFGAWLRARFQPRGGPYRHAPPRKR